MSTCRFNAKYANLFILATAFLSSKILAKNSSKFHIKMQERHLKWEKIKYWNVRV